MEGRSEDCGCKALYPQVDPHVAAIRDDRMTNEYLIQGDGFGYPRWPE
jgi:hypothetical protein